MAHADLEAAGEQVQGLQASSSGPAGEVADAENIATQRGLELEAGLASVLAPALVSSAPEAQQTLATTGITTALVTTALAKGSEAGGPATSWLPTVAAALGSTASSVVAVALNEWLEQHAIDIKVDRFPRWLKPAIDTSLTPVLSTLTEFSRERSRLVRESVEERKPILLSRHGKIVAAVVPLEEGAYEESEYRDAASRLHRERLEREAAGSPGEQLDDGAVAEIMSSADPATVAARYGVDTTTWSNFGVAKSGVVPSERATPSGTDG